MIYILLTDDWELRGNGEGCVEELQVKPMRKLLDVYERNGVSGTFYIEVMHQIAMKNIAKKYPELLEQSAMWEQSVIDAYRRGHDIQLHIHPQWKDAAYSNGRWILNECWDITKYEEKDVRDMFKNCLSYLKELFQSESRPLNIVSFRSGGWCIAPSEFMLQVLVDNDIKIDTSLAPGIKCEGKHREIDYIQLEEDFLPFCPDMKDARCVSKCGIKDLVCIPVFHFKCSPVFRMDYYLSKISNKLTIQIKNKKHGNIPYRELSDEKRKTNIFDKFKSKSYIADLSALSRWQLEHLLKMVLKKVYGLESHDAALNNYNIPIVLACHTKNITDYHAIDVFIRKLRAHKNINFVTLSQMNKMFQKNLFPIKYKTE